MNAPTPLQRVLIIANPVAGQRDFAETKRRIEARLTAAELDHRWRITEGAGDAERWARGAEGYDRVLVSGGDGTVMEAISGLVGRDLPLGQIPAGTANLLAQALGVPSGLEAALDVALGDEVVPFDVGHLPEWDRYFAMVAGAGWDARLIEDASRDLKDRLGFFAYVLTGFKNLVDLQRGVVTVTADGVERRYRAHTAMVFNIGGLHQRRLSLGDHIDPHDGALDVVLVSPDSVAGMLRIAARVLRGTPRGVGGLRYLTAKRIRIDARPPLRLQIDGEPIGTTPFTVASIPDGVRLVVPSSYRERFRARAR